MFHNNMKSMNKKSNQRKPSSKHKPKNKTKKKTKKKTKQHSNSRKINGGVKFKEYCVVCRDYDKFLNLPSDSLSRLKEHCKTCKKAYKNKNSEDYKHIHRIIMVLNDEIRSNELIAKLQDLPKPSKIRF